MLDLVGLVTAQAVPAPVQVRCLHCRALHKIDGQTYLTFAGNVFVGWGGGVIGNNFDEDGKLERVTILCRTKTCLLGVLDMRTDG